MTYYDNLYNFASDWVKKQFKSFTIEDIKKAFYEAGNKPPVASQLNVFGKLITQMKHKDLIYENGFTRIRTAGNKLRVVVVWISAEYKQKQSNNRKGDKDTLTINFEE